MESNSNEATPPENVDVTAGAPDGTQTPAEHVEASVEESRARLADELESKPAKRGGRRPGSGRKKKSADSADAASQGSVSGEVLPKAPQVPSMVPAFTKGIISLTERVAIRRDFPAYKLTDEQAAPLAQCLDAVLLRYAPAMSTEHPELAALVMTATLTFGPIVLADLADKDRRAREAARERARQSSMDFSHVRGAKVSDLHKHEAPPADGSTDKLFDGNMNHE